MINILSIDWDGFFPDITGFDWGAHEEAPFLFESIWAIRAGNRCMVTKKRAVDHVRPDQSKLNGFWDRVVKNEPAALVICESHKSLYDWLKSNPLFHGGVVQHFDAHHDFGYRKDIGKLDCGNWAYCAKKDGIIKEHHVVYPEWRKDAPERFVEQPDSVRYGLPDQKKYAVVFICRSSCWTPTWSDREWLKFIGYWKKFPYLWQSKSFVPFVMKARHPNLKEARKMATEQEAQLKELMAGKT
jgi:hypothetical protein